MASEDYIAAAKKANRQPTVLMKVQDASGNNLYYTSTGDWEGSDTLDEIDTAEEAGTAWHKKNTAAPSFYVVTSGTIGDERVIQFTAPRDCFLTDFVHGVYFDVSGGIDPTPAAPLTSYINARLLISKDNTFVTGVTTSDTFQLQFVQRFASTFDVYGWDNIHLDDINALQEFLSGETWYIKTQFSYPSNPTVFYDAWHDTAYSQNLGHNYRSYTAETAQLVTSTIDFGYTPSTSPIFTVDDVEENGETIVYSARGSTDNFVASDVSLGTIVDGDSLTAYRYYKITADFTTTNGNRGKIREIQLNEGIFRYYGTHIDQPFSGVLPYLVPDSTSTLNQKIDLEKGLSTTGEVTVKLSWVADTSDLISTGYMKGKDVTIYSGFVGLDTESYEPVISGTWYDYSLDEPNRIISVKIRDALKQFQKRKLPEETYNNTTGTKTSSPITYTTTNLVTVMLDIIDKLGIRDRYIHDDFSTLESGDYATNDYKVSRVISKPTEAFKLLDELALTGSMFLVPLGDGRIKPKPFDRNEAASVTLDAFELDFGNISGNQKDFFSRYYAYYNPDTSLTGDPGSSDDFDNGYALINATAELRWYPEKGTKEHLDKWKVGRTSAGTALTAPPNALITLVTNWDGFFTEPLFTVTVKEAPPRYASIEPGDIIGVDNLYLPVPAESWDVATEYDEGDRIIHDGKVWRSVQDSNTGNDPTSEAAYWAYMETFDTGLTDNKRFLVMGRKFNPNKALIDLELMEMPHGVIGGFDDGFDSGFDI